MSLFVKTGEYLGTGSGSITTNLSFTPKAVFLWTDAPTSGTSTRSRFKTDTMGANDSGGIGVSTFYTDGNITFSGDGFSVAGTSTNGMNISSKQYYWLALGGPECVTGSYVGNGTNNRNITGLGIDPDFVLVKRADNTLPYFKTSASGKTTDTSGTLIDTAFQAGFIKQLIADGFQVGNFTAVNQDSDTFHYLALQKSGNADQFNEGVYTGNGTDDRNITGLGFNPNFVAIKADTALVSRIRSLETTDTSSSFAAAATASNNIQQFVVDGFEIGTSNDVNQSSVAYYYFAFQDNEPLPTNTGNFLAFM